MRHIKHTKKSSLPNFKPGDILVRASPDRLTVEEPLRFVRFDPCRDLCIKHKQKCAYGYTEMIIRQIDSSGYVGHERALCMGIRTLHWRKGGENV